MMTRGLARVGLFLLASMSVPGPAHGDEGLWTPDHFPRQLVKERYGVEIGDAIVDRAIHAVVSFSTDGGSGAFVSASGLIAIKHGYTKMCLHDLREARRTAGRFARFCLDQALRKAIPLFDRLYCRPLDEAGQYDYVERGYLARTQEEELRCPGLEVTQLVNVSDVTASVRARLAALPAGTSAQDRQQAEDKACRELEAPCRSTPGQSYKVAGLFGGSRYELHRSKRYSDVRIVFSAERHMADFGDLQDHMTFPDHDFKTAFVRAYENGHPAHTPDHLPFSVRRLKEGDLTLMVANPGLGRSDLASALERSREMTAAWVTSALELRGILAQIAAQRPRLAPSSTSTTRTRPSSPIRAACAISRPRSSPVGRRSNESWCGSSSAAGIPGCRRSSGRWPRPPWPTTPTWPSASGWCPSWP